MISNLIQYFPGFTLRNMILLNIILFITLMVVCYMLDYGLVLPVLSVVFTLGFGAYLYNPIIHIDIEYFLSCMVLGNLILLIFFLSMWYLLELYSSSFDRADWAVLTTSISACLFTFLTYLI